MENELKQHGGRIVKTVNTSNLINHICKKHGAQLTVTRVGPPAMAEALRDDDAVLEFPKEAKQC